MPKFAKPSFPLSPKKKKHGDRGDDDELSASVSEIQATCSPGPEPGHRKGKKHKVTRNAHPSAKHRKVERHGDRLPIVSVKIGLIQVALVAHVTLAIEALGAFVVTKVHLTGEVDLSVVLNVGSETTEGMVTIHVVLVVVVSGLGGALVEWTVWGTSALDSHIVVVGLTRSGAVVIHAVLGISATAVVAVHGCYLRAISNEISCTAHFMFFFGVIWRACKWNHREKKVVSPDVSGRCKVSKKNHPKRTPVLAPEILSGVRPSD
jgi:hypothetical protein